MSLCRIIGMIYHLGSNNRIVEIIVMEEVYDTNEIFHVYHYYNLPWIANNK